MVSISSLPKMILIRFRTSRITDAVTSCHDFSFLNGVLEAEGSYSLSRTEYGKKPSKASPRVGSQGNRSMGAKHRRPAGRCPS